MVIIIVRTQPLKKFRTLLSDHLVSLPNFIIAFEDVLLRSYSFTFLYVKV